MDRVFGSECEIGPDGRPRTLRDRLKLRDPSERPKVGLRSREWTAIASTEEGVVREMARCLRELGAGRAPR